MYICGGNTAVDINAFADADNTDRNFRQGSIVQNGSGGVLGPIADVRGGVGIREVGELGLF